MDHSTLNLPDGRKLAYVLSEGATPGVVFLSGFKSDMTGTKATALEAFCRAHGRRYLRFDYSGNGKSSGAFTDGSIGAWKRDALDMLTHVAPGKNILVGSSMGGWLALLAALERPQDVTALVGIASAPDFTEKLIWDAFTPAQQQQLIKDGTVLIADCYGDAPYPITKLLIEEGRNHLLLDDPITLDMPVRLIHGTHDADVPWHMAVTLLERLASTDVQLQLIKNGNHRLSEPEQIAVILNEVKNLFTDPSLRSG